jgi:hypothetical protein
VFPLSFCRRERRELKRSSAIFYKKSLGTKEKGRSHDYTCQYLPRADRSPLMRSPQNSENGGKTSALAEGNSLIINSSSYSRFFIYFIKLLSFRASIILVLLFLPEKRNKHGTNRNPRHTGRDRAPCLRQTSSGNNLVLFATLSPYSS